MLDGFNVFSEFVLRSMKRANSMSVINGQLQEQVM